MDAVPDLPPTGRVLLGPLRGADESEARARPDGKLLRQPPEVIERLQDARLARMLGLCERGQADYRRRWAALGLDPGEIRTVWDLPRLLLTPKQDLMADPQSFRLRCADLPLHERMLWEVNYTTGSTGGGDPTPTYITTRDHQASVFEARRVAEISGITERDVIVNLLPSTPVGSLERGSHVAQG